MPQQAFGGEHTEIKLKIVEEYCKAYNTALSSQPFTRVYIDAFAGTGTIPKKTKKDLQKDESFLDDEPLNISGSATRALNTKPEFHKFVFIESSKSNCDELDTHVRTNFPDKVERVSIRNEDANSAIRNLCLMPVWKSHRAVLFLDPFGMEVEFQTIIEISNTKAIDMWVLFPLAGVNRLLKKDAKLSEEWENRLTKTFGDDSWKTAFYQEFPPEMTLFPETNAPIMEKCANWNAIGESFLKLLRSHFEGVATNPYFLSINGNPQYLLCFAAANKKGAPIAKRIAESVLGKYLWHYNQQSSGRNRPGTR